jgi:hypothetical protein
MGVVMYANKVDERPYPAETAMKPIEKLPHGRHRHAWPCSSVSVCLVALDS